MLISSLRHENTFVAGAEGNQTLETKDGQHRLRSEHMSREARLAL